ncbi:MAG: CBS domain-containing protein [Pikeienuella sp.]
MNVRQMLGNRAAADIATISETESLSDAAAILSVRKIGALIVTSSSSGVAGILSERDIVRRLAADGADCLSTPVSSAMTAKVMSCSPSDSAQSLLERMTEGRFRHMPVMDGDDLVGVISIGDVVKAHISEIEMEKQAMEDMIKGV